MAPLAVPKRAAISKTERSFQPENSIKVNGIYIRDHSGSPDITINGKKQKWTREGPDWKKRIKINWSGIIDNQGIIIDVRE